MGCVWEKVVTRDVSEFGRILVYQRLTFTGEMARRNWWKKTPWECQGELTDYFSHTLDGIVMLHQAGRCDS